MTPLPATRRDDGLAEPAAPVGSGNSGALAASCGPTAEDLARAAQAGSAEAFTRLVARCGPSLQRRLRGRVGSAEDARDLEQETFLRVHRYLHRYDAARPFAAWLHAIAGRLAAGHLRTRRRERKPLAALAASDRCDPIPTPAEAAAGREEGERLWARAQALLPAPQYRALWLKHHEGCSAAEAAAAMGLTPLHVRVLLHRARRRLLAAGGFAPEEA